MNEDWNAPQQLPSEFIKKMLSEKSISKPPSSVFTAGSGVYTFCGQCGKLVKMNKWILGSLHVCA